LYSYLVGCGESYREGPAGFFRPLKVHTYKDAGNSYRIKKPKSKSEVVEEVEFKVGEVFQDEDKLGVSSFGKMNQKSIGAAVSPKALGFLIGPVFEAADQSKDAYAEVFAPKIFIKSSAADGKL